jgi:Skp family chaperone for outer membrane proteins
MTTFQKVAAGAGVGILMLASQFYGDWSARSHAETRAKELTAEIKSVRDADEARIAELALELDMVQGRLGTAAADVKTAQQATATARQEQARAVAALRKTLDEQGRSVDTLRQESGAKIAEVRDQTSSQIGVVSDEVTTVKSDLGAVRRETASQFGVVNTDVGNVRTDLNATRSDLAASRKEMSDMRDSLGRQIAHNSEEVAALRRKGERDYFEFDIRKVKELERIAGVQVQLNKTDTKAKKYDMTLQIDDNKVQKKGQLVNEPVQFYVGKQRQRYELVVNSIDKDRIRGYVSKPKDGVSDQPTVTLK